MSNSQPARNNRKRRESRVDELGRRWTELREGRARRGRHVASSCPVRQSGGLRTKTACVQLYALSPV